ncbi:MAG: type II toxin-antitoxin system HicB family antitoxin [Rhodospirillales bacterium]
MMFAYAITLEPDETPSGEPSILVSVPALPGVHTFGETEAEAVQQASYAVQTMLNSRMIDNKDIPEPDAVPGAPCGVVPAREAMKVLLYQAMRRKGLDKESFRKQLNIGKRAIKQMFDLNHETEIEVLDAAMAALGREYAIADAPRSADAGAPMQAAG